MVELTGFWWIMGWIFGLPSVQIVIGGTWNWLRQLEHGLPF